MSYWYCIEFYEANQVKDYRDVNFGQKMAVLQNQWRLNGRRNVRAISTHKTCAVCDKPNARTYDLRVVIPGGAEKR